MLNLYKLSQNQTKLGYPQHNSLVVKKDDIIKKLLLEGRIY